MNLFIFYYYFFLFFNSTSCICLCLPSFGSEVPLFLGFAYAHARLCCATGASGLLGSLYSRGVMNFCFPPSLSPFFSMHYIVLRLLGLAVCLSSVSSSPSFTDTTVLSP